MRRLAWSFDRRALPKFLESKVTGRLRRMPRLFGGQQVHEHRRERCVVEYQGDMAAARLLQAARVMIRKLPSGQYRLYSRKIDSKTGHRRNLGTFLTREAALKHERAIQYFKRHPRS